MWNNYFFVYGNLEAKYVKISTSVEQIRGFFSKLYQSPQKISNLGLIVLEQ
jgi:hypothetical protein